MKQIRSCPVGPNKSKGSTILRALLACHLIGLALLLSEVAAGQVLNQHDTAGPQDMPTTQTAAAEIKGVVKVTVDMDKSRTFMAPRAMAVNSSISDSHLMDPELPGLLRGAGITTLRYPGGGFADNFHWATNKPSNSQVPTAQRYSGYAPNTDFGHFISLIDQVGTTVITVNYVVKYWEVGNEVYKNGYYGGEGETLDLHAPYPKEAKDNEKQRRKNPNLSPAAYGKSLVMFVKAMKAVDPRIKVGASIDSPVTNKWDVQEWTQDPVTGKYVEKNSFHKAADSGLDWDRSVLQVAGKDIDFVSLHWNTGNTTEASGWKELDNASLLSAPRDELPSIMSTLLELFQKYCGQNTKNNNCWSPMSVPSPTSRLMMDLSWVSSRQMRISV